ncbi:MAG: hypothetical protein QNI84_07325 [Henriciella sp.]|nr:hypothetical protein [Henriciella sp.]
MRAFLTIVFASLLACLALSMLPTEARVGSAFADDATSDPAVLLADRN